MTDQSIAGEVRAVIARKRASQTELAAALNLTKSALSRRVHGKIPFSAVELGKLAHELGVPVQKLYGEEDAA